MKIKTNIYGGMEIEIKGKGLTNEERYSKEDTMAFINWLSGIASRAAKLYEERGYDILEKEAQKFADILYDALDEKGYYDNIR